MLEFIDSLDEKAAIKVLAFIELLKEKGPQLLRPYTDHVREPIRELHVQVAHKSIRTLYFFMKGTDIVLIHSLFKKSNALKETDIRLAEARRVDWMNRFGGE